MSRPSTRPSPPAKPSALVRAASSATRSDAPARLDLGQRLSEALAASIGALGASGSDGGGDPVALTVARSPRPIAPAQLALAHGARDRQRACAMYQRCLQHYRSVLRAEDTGLATDDVGAALAHFATANLQALHGVQAPPEAWPALRRQLVAVVRSSPAWTRAAARERQAYVEQLGILAVLMADYAALARREGAAAIAHVQQGARGYLRQLLGLDPDALTLDAGGLALRVHVLAA
jgi:hypothetical protein